MPVSRIHFCLLVLLGCLFLPAVAVQANPTQFGDTGLLSQPTAGTLNEGNICVGIWANCSGGLEDELGGGSDAVIVPTTITMGLGTFMEVYGSYPNLLFNGDELASGRGYANAGFKFRVLGERSAPFRLGLDLHARRSISDDPQLDGLTDYASRVIASYKRETFGLHANAGYAFNDSPDSDNLPEFEDQVLFGGGIEIFPVNRLRLVAEAGYASERIDGQDGLTEAMVGFQYFLTPHLTMNLGAGVGLSDGSPDWRALFGFSTCQGVGFYSRPVPKLIDPDEVVEEEPQEPVKVVKIKTLTPLLSKVSVPDSPVSHLEMPVENPEQGVLVDPADRLKMPEISKLEVAVSPISPTHAEDGTELPENPFEATVHRAFRFPEFTFAFNQYDLTPEGTAALSLVAVELLNEERDFIISIEGHTDNIGSDGYNRTLSYRRAISTATHLVLNNGMDPSKIFVKGVGEEKPIADNATDEGRAKNRRVELLVLIPRASSGTVFKYGGEGRLSEDEIPPGEEILEVLIPAEEVRDITGAEPSDKTRDISEAAPAGGEKDISDTVPTDKARKATDSKPADKQKDLSDSAPAEGEKDLSETQPAADEEKDVSDTTPAEAEKDVSDLAPTTTEGRDLTSIDKRPPSVAAVTQQNEE